MGAERWKPSVTVAAVVCRADHYLLVEEMTSLGLRLNNPAGHLDPGESLIEGVCRETLEETACPFFPEAVVGVYLARLQRESTGEDITYLRAAVCGDVGDRIPDRALDHPVVRTLWMSLEEVRQSVARHRSPLVLQCIEDHAAGRRFDLSVLQAHSSIAQPTRSP